MAASLPLDPAHRPTKPRLVILGSGWGATSLLKNIDTAKYEVVVVSPTNYFLFTPLLPSATVGTIELRSLIEPMRRMLKRIDGRFIECEASDIDFDRCTVRIQDKSGHTADLPYDKLVIAVGSTTHNMGVPGVEHCHQLKTFSDAASIRHKIMDNFERAALPTTSPEERARLLSFVVCGGGPTGVEFAAELHEFLTEDLVNYFPEIPVSDVRMSIIQSQDHILNTYDRIISEYAEKHLKSTSIDIVTRSRVTRVEPDHIVVKRKGPDGKLLNEETILPFGLCLWSTGIGMRPLVRKAKEHLGEAQQKARALATDNQLRVRGVPAENVYAIGDCASIENPRLLDRIVEFFVDADTNKDGVLDRQEFARLGEELKRKYPHTTEHLNKLNALFDEFDVDHSGTLDKQELRVMLESIDRQMTALPATAQVASQQGKYMARKLNKLSDHAKYASAVGYVFPRDEEANDPFNYRHLGSLAYIGNAAVADFGAGRAYTGGWVGKYLWRGAYWNEQISLRTRVLLSIDWAKELLFGRDISRA
ncbi:pyridine nucleotide-disulfide oxidoreductase-domain-containing protein [Syncephalis pseudoplumigaleata]|uniref:Pyridine nucleotide-disulfide oxidoreductase-domain-containing protein n=1 Tax=Syncephalis pseudoplumigaleata TaxID=1712513 RepID=A0A4V1J1L8_9FUNG|nr:pyridine nucleotide-disulfide oxidoreductase-domain-containing protein [Syncephalis pseudoplumigaleata]|eukprot:RKP25509.1 pyridine nucleotide-disulfide oxidoreductase-domain-containing protein [Syncephalis pseudoplumigaleata]